MLDVLFHTTPLNYKSLLYYPQLSFQKEHIHFIVGESGCGKSTLLKLLNYTLTPNEGEVYYKLLPLSSYNPVAFRQKVSLMAQEHYLFEGSVYDQFVQYYTYRGLPIPDPNVILSFLNLCAFTLPLEHQASHLSGGEKQRLYLALFLSLKPEVLLLDEPSSALDEKTSFQLFENVTTYCKAHKITVICVSHSKSLATFFADTTIVLSKEANHVTSSYY